MGGWGELYPSLFLIFGKKINFAKPITRPLAANAGAWSNRSTRDFDQEEGPSFTTQRHLGPHGEVTCSCVQIIISSLNM